MLVYLGMYCWYLHKGFLLLRSRPYNSFRVGNILVRIQVASQITWALQTCSSPNRGFSHLRIIHCVYPIGVTLLAGTESEAP